MTRQILRPALAALPALLLVACATAGKAPAPTAATSIQVDVPLIERPGGESAAWWFRNGAAQAAERGAMSGRAKNLILVVGDGMSLPTVAAAVAYDLYKTRHLLDFGAGLDIAIGFAVAFVTALAVVRWVLGYIGRNGYALFGWWRIIVGGATLVALQMGL